MPSTAQLMLAVGEKGTDETKKKVSDLSDHVNKTSGFFKTALSNALSFAAGGAIFTGVGAAVGFLAGQMKDVVAQGMSQQAVMTETDNTLQHMGKSSGQTAQSIGDFADKMANLTGVSDDVIQHGENVMATFANIGKNVFPQATTAALNMSTMLKTDLQSSILQVGKAFNDPIKGEASLAREGVSFSNAEKESIKTMMAHNNIAGAQSVIMGELNKQFGGAAVAAGTTFGGQMARLNVTMDQTKEKIGLALIPVMTQLMNATQPLVTLFAGAFSRGVQGAAAALSGPLTAGLSIVRTIIAGIPAFLQALQAAFMNALGPDRAQKVAAIQTALAGAATVIKLVAGFLAQEFVPAMTLTAGVVGLLVNGIAHLVFFVQSVAPAAQATATTVEAGFHTIESSVQQSIATVRMAVNGTLGAIQHMTQDVIGGAVAWWEKWNGLIKGTAITLSVIFGPTLIMTGTQATIAGGKIAASFVQQVIATGTQSVVSGAKVTASFAVSMTKAGTEAVVSGAKITASFVVSMYQSSVQAVKTAASMTATLVPALLRTGVEFTTMAAKSVWAGIVALGQFAAEGYTTAAAMLSSVVPAIMTTVGSFVTMAATGIASAITGFIAYIPIAYAAAVATLATTWPILAVIAAIALLVIGIKLAVEHWTQITHWFSQLGFIQAAGAAFSGLGSIVHAVMNGIGGAVKGTINGVIGDIDTFISLLDMIQIHIPAIGVGPVKTPAFNWGGLGIPQIPYLADGGFIARGGMAMVGERGPERVFLPRGAQVEPHGGGQGTTQHIQIILDGRVLTETVVRSMPSVVRLATGGRV